MFLLIGCAWTLMAIIDSTRQPLIISLQFDVQQLEPKIKEWLEAKHNSWSPTYLDRLIQPLSSYTNPGDLLVLSPSGPLHSLPLHALGLEGEVLIQRNPVVYSPNLSILRQCSLRSRTVSSKEQKDYNPAVMLGVYEDEGNENNRDKVYQALERRAQYFKGKSMCGKAVTMSSVREYIERSGLIHFHGHTKSNDNILDESLAISPEIAEKSNNDNNQPEGEPEPKPDLAAIKVRDIFSFKLRTPTVMLIACSSGAQEVKPGDETLGFIPAFLYAGATSIIGTLWRTASVDGLKFTEIFYQHISERDDGITNDRLIDLAVAVQHTILAMRRETEFDEPYHWLHGAWKVSSFTPETFGIGRRVVD